MKYKEICSDDRGVISHLYEDMKNDEITVFKTNAGYARGGCIHEINDEYSTVIEGEVIYVFDGTEKYMREGESITIHRGEPHYFISVTDSIVLEWGATPEEKKVKHTEFRKIVDDFNSRGNNDKPDRASI